MYKSKMAAKIEREISLIASFVVLLSTYLLFKNTDLTLHDYSKLYISEATLDNIDVSGRVALFFKITAFLLILLPIGYLSLLKLKSDFSLSKKLLNPLSIISFIGIIYILLDLIGIESKIGLKFFSVYFIYAIGILAFTKIKRSKKNLQLHHHPVIITLTILLLTAVLLLFNSNSALYNSGVFIYFAINFGISTTIQIIKKKSDLSYTQIFKILSPFCLIPIFLFISIESIFFFKLKYDFFIPYKWLFLSLISVSIPSYFIFFYKRSRTISIYQLQAKYFIPSAIISLIIFISYHPYLLEPTELFELANTANAQMKLFEFKEIPFVDYMSSHMFSEQFYGIIHGVIFGYNKSLDFITYQFFYYILFTIIVYCFLLKFIKNPFLVFLFIIIFPFIHILFNTHLFFGILILFSIQKLFKNQTIKNYLFLFILIFSLFLWRLDTGAATCMATLLFFPLSIYSSKINLNFKVILKAFLLFILLLTIIVGIAIILKSSEYLLSNFKNALHYAAGNQAHGYTQVSKTFPQQFYFFHFVFPLISIFSILKISYSLRMKTNEMTKFSIFSLNAALFLYILYLANFQRGIVRHSFMESNDIIISSTFYIATTLFIISFLKEKENLSRISNLFNVSLVLILFLSFFPLNSGNSNIDNYFSKSPLQNIDSYFQKETFKGKIIENKEFSKNNYKDIKQFLDKNISKNQTFMDFSNTPMLYFNCHRNVPSYFCQNLQNTIDDYQQFQQIKSIPLHKVPIVVYSNYPTNWFDRTDNVPNSMRQYLIAEYIYKNYKPFGIINKHSIWTLKTKNIAWKITEKDTLAEKPQTHQYKKAASLIYHHFTSKKEKEIEKLSILRSLNSTDFCLPEKTNNEIGVFISFQFEKVKPSQEIKFEIVGEKGVIGIISFITLENENNYMVRLSNHYLWHIQKPKFIRILNLEDTRILRKIQLYKDLRNGH